MFSKLITIESTPYLTELCDYSKKVISNIYHTKPNKCIYLYFEN